MAGKSSRIKHAKTSVHNRHPERSREWSDWGSRDMDGQAAG